MSLAPFLEFARILAPSDKTFGGSAKVSWTLLGSILVPLFKVSRFVHFSFDRKNLRDVSGLFFYTKKKNKEEKTLKLRFLKIRKNKKK